MNLLILYINTMSAGSHAGGLAINSVIHNNDNILMFGDTLLLL